MNIQHYLSLIAELKIMVHLRPHVNVIGLVGACTCGIEKRQLFVLTEFCGRGSLLDYLDDHRLDFEPVSPGNADGDSRLVSAASKPPSPSTAPADLPG